MNVLYAGIENPVSVSASVSAERVSISLAGGGSFTQTGPGKYNITVQESLVSKTITINISADIGGRQQAMGSNLYRIKKVPDPEALIGNKVKGGKMKKTDLLANPFIFANMGVDFVYDLRWTVNSFTVTFIIRGIEDPPMTCSSNQFTEAVKSKLNSCSPGTVVYFSDIRVSSVAGTRTLNPIAVILN
jgi:hypothetical protein